MRNGAIAFCVGLLFFSRPWSARTENLLVPAASGSPTKPAPSKTDAQIVSDLLVKMLDRWNARDIDGLMSVYWHSPSLLAVIDTEQFDGWENLYRSYQSQSRNPTSMGIVNPTRVQVQLLKPDLAFGIVSWTMRYPENAQASEVVGTTTVDLQKFGPEWKIVAVHTSFTEM
jgi:ketosteroid isomerase-like protein